MLAPFGAIVYIYIYISRSCLKEGISGKCINSTFLKSKVATRSQYPKLLANAMRLYPWGEKINTENCVLKGS